MQGSWQNMCLYAVTFQQEQGNRGGNRVRRNKWLRLREIWQVKASGDREVWLLRGLSFQKLGEGVERDARNKRGLTSGTENSRKQMAEVKTSTRRERHACAHTHTAETADTLAALSPCLSRCEHFQEAQPHPQAELTPPAWALLHLSPLQMVCN